MKKKELDDVICSKELLFEYYIFYIYLPLEGAPALKAGELFRCYFI